MPQDITPQPHAGITQLHTYVPGKPIEDLKRELGLEHIIKLASNENPLGTSPAAQAALSRFDGALYRYPDGAGYDIKQRLAAEHGVDPTQITLGNGSDDVLELTARVFLGPGRNAVISQHAFAVYPIVTQAVNGEVREVAALDAAAEMPYGHDLAAMREAIDENTGVVFMASPNNPTGTWLSNAALTAFLESVPPHVVVVLDQAYIEYQTIEAAPPVAAWLARFPNLIVTRTFSKIYGMAALRFGYGLASSTITDYLNRVRAPFNVNTLAMHCALAALDDTDFITHSVTSNTAERDALARELAARGLPCLPSQANFLTFDTGGDARETYEAMLRAGVIVRPLAGYGLAQHLRVTVGSAEDNAVFLAALDRVLDR
ncbi:histidinol-phosphate transaminase [Salinisphaera sp. Q1T1-3]|uniref:histidinol-phosphate transaminase n=1 Tax=Salinisphaera sp. Q1T1-3 TaxID=2321229 RepID=UPI000E76881D|nr:histidinol-phosphate transaminase [Salinisphaera sp. Q1T1-3]RJS92685.1 histidinol-phosphate transaminase [Salinisphaera sp. Q1T1-3]